MLSQLSKTQLRAEFSWAYKKLQKERKKRYDDFLYLTDGILDFSTFITTRNNANRRLHHYYRHIDKIMVNLACV